MADEKPPVRPQAMQALNVSNPSSDTEGNEKPVREQLKKTSIDATANGQPLTNQSVTATELDVSTAMDTRDPAITSDDRTRRKRSRDNDDEDEAEVSSKGPNRHGRKRSRDNDAESSSTSANASDMDSKPNTAALDRTGTPPVSDTHDGALADSLVSPKNKRTRAQFQKDGEDAGTSGVSQDLKASRSSTANPIKSEHEEGVKEREAKRPREVEDEKPPTTIIPPSSGFGNVSSVSPFAALSNTDRKVSAPVAEMHASTIKDQNTSSPFGALGQSSGSGSPFGTLAGAAKPAADVAPKTASAFGGLGSTQSAFGSIGAKSAFGGGGGGGFGVLGAASSPFASAMSGKPGLSSFASSSSGSKPPILGLSSKPAKPFGAPLSDEEDNGESDDEDADQTDVSKDIEQGINPSNNEPKRDKRFVEQETETGEEHERTLFSSRAKLYYFDATEKGWKERGVGSFRFNVSRSAGYEETDNDDSELPLERKARFIMRAEGSHRLLLNSPVSSNTKFGDAAGQCPKGTTVLWFGVLEGHDQPVGLQLKMKADLISSLWETVDVAKQELS